MAKLSAITTPSLTFDEGSAPSTPASGDVIIYAKTDGLLYSKDDAGTETLVSGGAGGGGDITTDAAWAAKGDLIVATGNDAASVLTVGANGTRPEAASGESTGIKWSYPPGYEFDYTAYTSGNINVTATAEASADTLVTGGAVSYDGSTVICLEFFAPVATSQATAGNNLIFYLYDGSSSVGIIAQYTNPASSAARRAVYAKLRLTPSNASHTYSVRATTSAGTGVVGNGTGGSSGAYWPMYIRQTKA